jgi:hypothetical protein
MAPTQRTTDANEPDIHWFAWSLAPVTA